MNKSLKTKIMMNDLLNSKKTIYCIRGIGWCFIFFIFLGAFYYDELSSGLKISLSDNCYAAFSVFVTVCIWTPHFLISYKMSIRKYLTVALPIDVIVILIAMIFYYFL